MQDIFTIKNIIIYLLIINIIGFLAMYIDKQKAKKGKWRIPEKTLFIITVMRRRNWNNCRNVHIQTQNTETAFHNRTANNNNFGNNSSNLFSINCKINTRGYIN